MHFTLLRAVRKHLLTIFTFLTNLSRVPTITLTRPLLTYPMVTAIALRMLADSFVFTHLAKSYREEGLGAFFTVGSLVGM